VTFSTAPQIQIRQEIRVQANSVVQTAQNLGSSIGMAVYTLIMATFGLAAGLQTALILAGITAVVLLVVSQFLKKNDSDC
jgi:sugar phosphate permease